MGLQRFKLHLANSVFTQENSSLQSMDTTQLLDLMNYSGTTAGEAALGGGGGEAAMGLDGTVPEPSKGGKGGGEKSGLKSVLENLGELWGEEEYQAEYDLDAFLSTLKGT